MNRLNRGRVFTLLISVVIVIAVGIYVNREYNTEVSSDIAYNNANLVPGAPYINREYGFKITPPANWVIADENQTDAVPVEFVDRTKNVQALIRVTLISKSEITNSNFDAQVSAGEQKVKNTPGVSFISSQKLASSSVSSYLMEYTIKTDGQNGYKVSGANHILQSTSLLKNGHTFIVTGIIDEAVWLNFKDVVKNSLLSLSSY